MPRVTDREDATENVYAYARERKRVMPLVWDAIYLLLLLLVSPWLVYRSVRTGKYRGGYSQKLLGRAPRRIGQRPCLWLHAVSVGEVLALRPLVAVIARRRPDWEIFLSTTTDAGLQVARQTFPELVTFFAPLDFRWSAQRALERIRPDILGLVELEVWPNLIRAAKRANAKVAVLNGRISAKSHRGYRRIRPLMRSTFRALDCAAVQTEEYGQRFLDLGVKPERIVVTGSIKYDGLETDRNRPLTRSLRKDLGIQPTDIVFVAGSTMEGEESAALAAYLTLRVDHPHLRLIVVPRHPHRFDEVADLLAKSGEPVRRRSVTATPSAPLLRPPVILIDTMGELGAVWGLADIAFVGGSLFPGRGGQNMMEPAAFGASVLFGPHTQNFREPVEALRYRNAARVIDHPAGLVAALRDNLEDPESAHQRGAAARTFVLSQRGATEATLNQLDLLFDPTPHPPMVIRHRTAPHPRLPAAGPEPHLEIPLTHSQTTHNA